MHRIADARLPLAAALLLAACGPADPSAAPPSDAGGTPATNASVDPPRPDAQPPAPADGALTPDAAHDDAERGGDGDQGATPPDAAPPEPDAALAPAPHCAPWGPPPAPAPDLQASPAGLRLTCQDGAFDLFLTATPAGVAYERLSPGVAPRLTSFAVRERPPDDPQRWTLAGEGGALLACLDHGTLHVERSTCALTLRTPDGTVLFSAAPATDAVQVEPGVGPDAGAPVQVTRQDLDVPSEASVLGFGQHTGPLDRRGTRFTHWNTDAYDPAHGGWAPGADPLYAALPFGTLLHDAGSLGVFVDETRRTTFDIGATRPGRITLTSHGAPTLWLLPGRGLAEPMQAYRDLVGAPALPPRWAFGFQQSRWGYDTAAEVLAVAERFRALDLPADALWLDIQHMDGFRTFTFDPVRFPDPSGLLGALRAQGFRTVVIADPGLKVDPAWPVYRTARDGGLFLRTPAGADFVGTAWPGEASFLDFTLPAARDLWAAQVAALRGLGVAGVWLDVNEPTTFPEGGGGLTVPNDTPTSDARTMAEVHNVYGQLEAEATYAGLAGPDAAGAPAGRPLIVSRAGHAGLQRVAGLWTGDTPSTWDALRQTLPMLLSMGVAGVPYVGSDVGGYSGGATPELYARWLQLGALSPFFRAHVTSGVPGQEPWQFGIEVTDIARLWLGERMRLVPYFESLALEAQRTGAPPLRPLAWAFPGEVALRGAGDTAMLGPFLLAAPVLTAGETTRVVALPPGRWVEYHGGAALSGGAQHVQTVTLAALPLYLREGALLPRAATSARETDALPEALRVDVVPGPSSTFRVPRRHDGPPSAPAATDADVLTLRQTFANGALRIVVERPAEAAATPVELVVRLLDAAPSTVLLDDAPLAPPAYTLDLNDRTLHVDVPPGQARRLEVTLDAPLPDDGATVEVVFEVDVPPGTPVDPPVHIAGDFNGWTHVPLAWTEPGLHARGSVRVPRSQWYQFKFTRGGWETVEKWPDCAEATNRYALGAAHPDRHERVFGWRDGCP